MPGPIPNRSDDLARPQYDANRKGNIPLSKGVSIPSEPLAANEDWDSVIARLYNSVHVSGISAFYEASDWAMLYLLCDELDAAKKVRTGGGKLPAIIFQTILSHLTSLGLTEGERRRMRIELEAAPDKADDASVTHISSYRKLLNDALTDGV